MRMTLHRTFLAVGAAASACLPVHAQDAGPAGAEPKAVQVEKKPAALKAGDPAPPLSVESWVKGEPVTGFEQGRVYVVEFWATWCAPCIVAIPHLTHLQAQYKDKVRFIGVSSSDKDLATVESFVRQQGDRMGYAIAFDADKSMSEAWMKPAGRGGIPCSFVVDRERKIAWIGHPRVGLDAVLAKVVDGTFNPAAWAKTEARADELRRKAFEAGQAEDYAAAEKALTDLGNLDPSFAADAGMMKFRMLLLQKRDYSAASAAASALLGGPLKDDADALKEIAWTILEAEGVQNRDVDLAMKIALRAVEIGNGDDALIIDTLARAYWAKGDKAKAIEWQKKAVEKAAGGPLKTELESTLHKYEGK